MKNYTIPDLLNILENINKYNIIETIHFKNRNYKRNNNKTYTTPILYKEFLTKKQIPVEIAKQDKNKFRIKYNNKFCKTHDFCLIMAIENNNIILITTINTPIQKRVGGK